MSDLNEKVLFETLHKAIQDDKRYWIRNDAKIRASLTSKNYDEFREIVDAAHLNPLSAQDKKKKGKMNWNKMTKGE